MYIPGMSQDLAVLEECRRRANVILKSIGIPEDHGYKLPSNKEVEYALQKKLEAIKAYGDMLEAERNAIDEVMSLIYSP